MRVFKIKEDLLTAVIKFISSRPYSEVYQLVVMLGQLEELRQDPVANVNPDTLKKVKKQ